jgi:serine/threonine protein kinase
MTDTLVGQFRIEQEIGKGSFATVYRAHKRVCVHFSFACLLKAVSDVVDRRCLPGDTCCLISNNSSLYIYADTFEI